MAKKKELKEDPTTDEISWRCTDCLFGKITKFLQDGREPARTVFFEKIGYFVVSWRALKGEGLWSRPILEVMQESSVSSIQELKDIPTAIEKEGPDNPACNNNKFILKLFLNKCENMNFSAIHDVKRVMNRVDWRSTESTE